MIFNPFDTLKVMEKLEAAGAVPFPQPLGYGVQRSGDGGVLGVRALGSDRHSVHRHRRDRLAIRASLSELDDADVWLHAAKKPAAY